MTKFAKLKRDYNDLFLSAAAVADMMHEYREKAEAIHADYMAACRSNLELAFKNERLEIDNDQLARWKAEMLHVYNQVDVNKLGAQMGLTLGMEIFPRINEFVDNLIFDLKVAEQRNKVYQQIIELQALFTDN